MKVSREYQLDFDQAVASLESLAESFMNPEFMQGYTIRGITIGKSQDSQRRLLPKKIRFILTNLLSHNLEAYEDLTAALVRYRVLGRDDYCWYLWIDYIMGRAKVSVGDNTTWGDPDEYFEQLYQRLFGTHFLGKLFP